MSPRDTFKRWLGPKHIFWEDAEGNLHISMDNACRSSGLEPTEANQEKLRVLVVAELAEMGVTGTRIVYRTVPASPDNLKARRAGPGEN